MAEFPAMPLWTDAYLGDTTHLTTIEHGAYLLLLMAMWRTEAKRLPNDDKLLARYARLTPGQWRKLKVVLMPFFRVHGEHITQGRLTDEANAVRRSSAKQSDRAKARWLKTKEPTDAAAMPDECRNDATLTHTLSVAKATDADGVQSVGEILWTRGVAYLVRHGVKDKQARSLIGRWRKDHGDDAVMDAFRLAGRNEVSEPVSFITATLKPKADNADQKLEAWGIGDAKPLRVVPGNRDLGPEGDAGTPDLPRMLAPAEGGAQAHQVPVGDANGGWGGGPLPSLQLVCGCAL